MPPSPSHRREATAAGPPAPRPRRRRWPRVAAIALLLLVIGLGAWSWTPDLDERTLHARYLASPADLVEVGGTRLHVRDEGPRDAPALLLLHGFGSSLHTWDDWARALAARHRVLRIDLPGHGLSGPDASGDYTDARSHALLVGLLDARGIDRATLVGHSIGGRIAWSFAARHPERIERLVLVAPDGFASPGFEYGRAPEVSPVASAMRWLLPRTLVRASLAPAYGDPAVLTESLLDRYHDLLRAPGVRDAVLRRMSQTVLEDPRPRLAAIHAPTLLLWGERDALIPVANADDYLATMREATLRTLPGVGHIPQEEAPDASVRLVEAFVDGDASGVGGGPPARPVRD